MDPPESFVKEVGIRNADEITDFFYAQGCFLDERISLFTTRSDDIFLDSVAGMFLKKAVEMGFR